jgi:hypothetical protein
MISYQLEKKLKDAGFPQGELARAQQEAGYSLIAGAHFMGLSWTAPGKSRLSSDQKHRPRALLRLPIPF